MVVETIDDVEEGQPFKLGLADWEVVEKFPDEDPPRAVLEPAWKDEIKEVDRSELVFTDDGPDFRLPDKEFEFTG